MIMPAILVLVLLGQSASKSLLLGLSTANEILHRTTNITAAPAENVNSTALNLTFGEIRVAVGITAGVSLSELLAKRKMGYSVVDIMSRE